MQIIDFEIKIDLDIVEKEFEYVEFINCIFGNDEDKYKYVCIFIGYLFYKYKDLVKLYCVILVEENDNESKGGGIGKGIFLIVILKLVNIEWVDGKNFKLDKNFVFQWVGLDIKLVVIEDIRKNVDFEGFYLIIIEGIIVEKKNKDELFILYKDSFKIVFMINYIIINNGVYVCCWQKIFEFVGFFGVENMLVMYFGYNFFFDWDLI